ncbi:MAG: HAD family phosphatase [Spirochaetales bacterium]|nr:HAD family phosphatase [Spirochaetales bacterium]
MIETLSLPIDRSSFDYKGIVITDLDGTLLDKNRKLKEQDYKTLVMLKHAGFLRVLATGRNLYSLFSTIDDSFPVDYIIFSCGAGVWDHTTKDYTRIITMDSPEVQQVASFFASHSLDFAVHNPIPDNHYFYYYLKNDDNQDFEHRIRIYKEYTSRWENLPSQFPRASQLLAIVTNLRQKTDQHHQHIYDEVSIHLPGFTVIRTTSPLDHVSLWIEVFPENVSKGKTSHWLASQFNIDKNNVLAVGNDYNDLDLLTWATSAYIVSNGPADLKAMFPSVASHDECGFSEAVKKWLTAMNWPVLKN